MNRQELQAAIQEKSAEIAELQTELNESYGRTLVACITNTYGQGCGKKSQIRKLTHIQPYWYVPPSGCSDGDYWTADNESQWDCPHCGHRNRAHKYERPEVMELRQYFGKQATTHDEQGRPPKVDES